jgi:hypothetical protein
LRNIIRHIAVDITATINGNAYIDKFVDNYEDSVNTLFVPGDVFSIYGNKIKVDGDSPDCGVFFVPVEDPSKAVKVKHIVENFPTKIIGEAPDTQFMLNRIEIRTQYTGGSVFLKIPRVIASNFVIEAA